MYWNALDNAFHLDDFFRVQDNPGVEQLHPIGRHFTDPRTIATLPRLQQYRPLLPLSLSLDYALTQELAERGWLARGGHDVRVYHAVNVLVHVVSCLLLYRLVRALLRPRATGIAAVSAGAATDRAGFGTSSAAGGAAPAGVAWAAAGAAWAPSRLEPSRHGWVALAVALLYAVHPVSGAPINYICARDLLLMQVFLLGSLVTYVALRTRGGGAWRWPLALLLYALSLLSKTNGVAFPAVILVYELLLGERRLLAWRTWLRVLPFAAVAVAFFAVTRLALDFSDVEQLGIDRTSWADRIAYGATMLDLHVTYYLRNVVYPFAMRPLADVDEVRSAADPGLIAGVLAVALSLLLAWCWRRRAAAVGFAVVTYWVLFAPTSSIVPFRYLAVDYRAYPSLAFLLVAACIALHGLLPRRARVPVYLVVLAWAAGTSVWHNTTYHDEEVFWRRSVQLGGRDQAYNNYGRALLEQGELDAAREQFEIGVAKNPENVLLHLNLGLVEIRQGDVEQGVARLDHAATLAPDWGDALYWRAIGLVQAGQPDRAADSAVRAVEADPRRPLYREYAEWLVRSGLDAATGQGDAERIAHYRALSARLDPGDASEEALLAAWHDAAWAARGRGDHERALELLARIHERRESWGTSRFLEGLALQRTGRPPEEAIAAYRLALRADPDAFQTHFNIGYAFKQLGRCAEAVEHFERTLELAPDYPRGEPHLYLAECLEQLGDAEGAARHRALYDAVQEGAGG